MRWIGRLRENFERRPLWMNGLMIFCFFMAIIYVPWDFAFKPIREDEEVWFGILLTGWFAKATEPLHWAIYAAGAAGFWQMRTWMHPWAVLYVMQIAISMLVWSVLNEGGSGLFGAVLAAVPFLLLAVALWRAKSRFNRGANQATQERTE